MGMVPPLAPRPISTPHVHGGTYEQGPGTVFGGIQANWAEEEAAMEPLPECPRWLKNFKLLRIRGWAPWKRFEFPKVAAVEPVPAPPKQITNGWKEVPGEWNPGRWLGAGNVPGADDVAYCPHEPEFSDEWKYYLEYV